MPVRAAGSWWLVLPLVAAGCRTGWQVAQRQTRSVPVPIALTQPAPGTLEVQFHSGLLVLEPADRLQVTATADLTADDERGLDALALALSPTVDERPDGSHTRLQVCLPGGAGLDALRVVWRLSVPEATRVLVHTREGAVVARDCRSHLEVRGGCGMVEVAMAGAAALLSTTSGSIVLRGEYPFAELRSGLGRIDAEMPPLANSAFELAVVAGRGDVYLDLHDGQRFELDFRGDLGLVRPDPAVRIEFLQTIDSIDRPHNRCALGDLGGLPTGRLAVEAAAPVHVRRVPAGAGGSP